MRNTIKPRLRASYEAAIPYLAASYQSPSLLRSRFLGCHATLPPKKLLLTSEQHGLLDSTVINFRTFCVFNLGVK